MTIEPINFADPRQASALHGLQQAAYRAEAILLGTTDFPPLRETLDELVSAAEATLGAWDGEHLCGAITYQVSGHSIDLCKLIIDPSHFRLGLGSFLVWQLLHAFPGFPVAVTTGSRNTPALRLYTKLGFSPRKTWIAKEGNALVMLVRSADREEETPQEPWNARSM